VEANNLVATTYNTVAVSSDVILTSMVSFERQSIMGNPTTTMTMEGSSIVPDITAPNSQSLYALTSALASGDIPTATPKVTTEFSSFRMSTEPLDRQRTSATLTVGNSTRTNDIGAALLSYYSRNVGLVMLAALSFILLIFSIALHAVVRYLIRRQLPK